MNKSQIDNVVNFVNQKNSRYSLRRTTISDFQGVRMYDYPFQPNSPQTSTDKFLMITSPIRLDQIANDEYGDSKLWWVLAKINNIINPLETLEVGSILRIPQISTLILNKVLS